MNKSFYNLPVCLFLLVIFGLGCGLVKNPLRDYTAKPFSSAEWLKGDAVERGRMYPDIFITRMPSGKSKAEIAALLGEPDEKQTVEGREVWLYRVEHSSHTPMKYFPVSFESNGRAFAGRIKAGTMSMIVED